MNGLRILLAFIYTILLFIAISFIDVQIITPLLPLGDDLCHFHFTETPTWVRLFYLNNSGHPEYPYSGLHLAILVILSFVLAIYLSKKTDNWLKKRGI